MLSVNFKFADLPDNLNCLPFESCREFIESARWFQNKTGKISNLKIFDRILIDHSPNRLALLLLCRIESADKSNITNYSFYHVPIIATLGEHQEIEGTRITRLKFLDGTGEIIDAVNVLSYVSTIYTLLEKEASLTGDQGVFKFTKIQGDQLVAANQLSAQFSHSVTLVKRDDVVKTFRHLALGRNADLVIAIKLSASGWLGHIPTTFGFISYTTNRDEEYTLALFQKFVPNEGNAWEFTLDWLRGYYQKLYSRLQTGTIDKKALTRETEELATPYLKQMRKLGETIAFLHHHLSIITDADFSSEEISSEDIQLWCTLMQEKIDNATATVSQHLPQLNKDVKQLAKTFIMEAPNLKKIIQELITIGPCLGKKCRIHQDLHLGQILKTKKDFVILDFEGEPVNKISTRSHKQSPLQDLAGMVRSFNYAAYKGLFSFISHLNNKGEDLSEQDYACLTWAGQLWLSIVTQAFLQAYRHRANVEQTGLVPVEDKHFNIALAVFTLAKAVYEVMYEINNRPEWLQIPLAGIINSLHNLKEVGV